MAHVLLKSGLENFKHCFTSEWASLVAQMLKRLPTMQEARGSIPGPGRYPGEGNGNPLQ